MKKLKINLQMFASTNSTDHYNLSQYIGTDKPTYLVDYNQDMNKIDTGIYAAKSKADTNETNIGTLSNLTTTEKLNLVGAINEIDSNNDNNTTAIGVLTNLRTTEKSNLVGAINEVDTKVDNNKTAIGELTNLNTTNKSNLVDATNEVLGDVGNIASLSTTNKSNVVNAVNEIFNYLALTDNRALSNPVITDTNGNVMSGASVSRNTLRVALNSSGTYGKIYGQIDLNGITAFPKVKFTNTGINGIEEAFTIDCAGIVLSNSGSSIVRGISLEIAPPGAGETSASITLAFGIWDSVVRGMLFPCIYYFTDFGDVVNY